MPFRRHPNLMGAIELALWAVLAVIVCFQTYYLLSYVQEQREITDRLTCQVQLNDVFRQAITDRTASTARERQAQREFLAGSLDGLSAEELRAYLDALDAADRDRANTPLPQSRC